ncbi:MAG: hypothetical protein KAI24_21365 [Planctomycetes bacterium]|nr:hypothetical protein [Planctomycetota bacterium]
MRTTSLLSLLAFTAAVSAQTTVYPNTAPRATSVVVPGSDVGAPPLMYFGASATDGTSLLVYGGRGVNTLGNAISVWYTSLNAYNPTTNTWTTLSADGNPSGPTTTTRPGMAYDPVLNRVVIFGGSDSNAGVLRDETWAFDLGSNTWSLLPNPSPGVTAPTARAGCKMAYDAATGVIILFGGQGAGGSTDRKNDTWLLSGGSWVQLSPATSPSARDLFGMTARSAPYNDIVMLGGRDLANVRLDDTWRWDGANTTWVQILPINGTTPVTFCGGNDAYYDSVRECVVVINGTGTNILPSNITSAGSWTSEYDCVLNEWRAYGDNQASQSAEDPLIGRLQRFPVAFINGKAWFWAGQNPASAGDANLPFVKEYQASPVAAAAAYGAGCAGPGGVLTMAADNAPWTGRTFTATCTNLAPNALALEVWGLTQASTPLAAVLPQAGVGCLLLNDATLLLGPSVAAGGAVTAQLALPSDPALAGVTVNVQVAELEFDASFSWTGLYTSNGVAATIGALR